MSATPTSPGHYRVNYSHAGEVGELHLTTADYSGSKVVRVRGVGLCSVGVRDALQFVGVNAACM